GVFLLLGGFAVGKLVSFEKTWQTTVLVIVVALLAAVYMLLAYRAVKSGNTAVYLAAMAAPVANTGIFILGMALFFKPLLDAWAGGGAHVALFVISGLVGINFLIEFSVAVLLSPAIATIVKVIRKKR
ncbi:MAG: ECF transporter S component, partial [Clostridia bacterium]|nr:ECF transporter S component [Clostridia bacterium]